jgi:hypothetical protein
LFVGNTGSKGVGRKVAANTDSCALDHSSLILWEWWALETIAVHFRNVVFFGREVVVLIDDWVEEFVELLVRAVRACINTDT